MTPQEWFENERDKLYPALRERFEERCRGVNIDYSLVKKYYDEIDDEVGEVRFMVALSRAVWE